MSPKKVLIALPPKMLDQVDDIAYAEFRTRSDLIREALRTKIDNYRKDKGEVQPRPRTAVMLEEATAEGLSKVRAIDFDF